MTPLLEVSDLTMRFGGLKAVDGLSFTAARGEITAVIGPNGAGKTTAFNCITGSRTRTVRRSSWSGCRDIASPAGRRSRARSRTSGCSPA
jgi:ABC-type branched-subunit amino acid transport system ATPase component